MQRILPYILGTVVLVLVSVAACTGSSTSSGQHSEDRIFSGSGHELEDLMTTPTMPSSAAPATAAPALAQLPAGITGFYAPAGESAGALPQGAGYQIIGRYGSGWLLLRLPEHGQFWVPAAALAGIDMSAIPDYQEGSTP
jgi:hypothetical protein